MDINIFLDSGAFSAWSQKKEIDIKKYISFIKENKQYINYYAVLDSIGDPEKTLENQKIMESEGLTPIPCFHYGEDFSYLEMYVKKYQYIALGGMVSISHKNQFDWLDKIFSEFICNKKDMMPKVKVHGFGVDYPKILLKYPWYSVDSSGFLKKSAYGYILVPRLINKEISYEKSYALFVTERAKIKQFNSHFDSLAESEKKFVLNYLKQIDIKLGKSVVKKVTNNYCLKKDELWVDEKERIIEIKKESGIVNNNFDRTKAIVNFYCELQKTIPEWPFPFKKKNIGFNL